MQVRLKMRVTRSIALLSCIAALCLLQVSPSGGAEAAVPGAYQPKSKRDFTGIWEHSGSFGWRQDVALGRAQEPPFTPAYQRKWEQYLADDAAGKQYVDPVASCLPPGMPRMMSMPYPMEIMQNGTQVNIFSEWMEQIRRIFIDGRPLPKDPDPTFNGYSVGHFEGEVLVAETIGLRGDTLIDVGMLHSGTMRVRERIWLADHDTLKDQITLIDPEAFLHPWVTTKTYRRADRSMTIMPWVCLENNRNPIDAQGHVGFTMKSTPTPAANPSPEARK
jgi:hypothetical protein